MISSNEGGCRLLLMIRLLWWMMVLVLFWCRVLMVVVCRCRLWGGRCVCRMWLNVYSVLVKLFCRNVMSVLMLVVLCLVLVRLFSCGFG